jgi:L-asparaginase II
MSNPVLVHVTRGGIVESRHRGAFAVADAGGGLGTALGDIASPIFPRSAIKAFQALAMVEMAADRFGFTDAEIALACASHSGEPEHVRVARAMLAKLGLSEADLECGAHWPYDAEAQHALGRGRRAARVPSTTTARASTPACWRSPWRSAPIRRATRTCPIRCSA